MAYDFVPTTQAEIKKEARLGTYRDEITTLFLLLRNLDDKVKDPIAIDVGKKAVKILPSFEKKVKISDLKTKSKITAKMDFGRGTRGIAAESKSKIVGSKDKSDAGGNKGILFEKELIATIDKYQKGDRITNNSQLKCVEEIYEKYDLKNKDVKLIPEGALNKKRPIVFQGDGIYIGGSNFDIGSTVTDITLQARDPKTKRDTNVYLSLKYGNTVTFFNSGVQKILTKSEIDKGMINNANGLTVLKLFGIDPRKFCNVFLGYTSGAIEKKVDMEDTFDKLDKTILKNLIKSGVGYGYELVHKDNKGSIHNIKMTSSQLDISSTPKSCKVYYGGLGGGGKRIDMVVETPMFTLKFNIRSKFRGIIYPTHMMCDYTIKH